jgi:hypothetical protein
VIVLLSSCFTQGIGWLFGPFIQFTNVEGAEVFGWIFIIFNGLEGFYAIILYILIRAQHIDEQKRVMSQRDYKKSKNSKSDKYKQSSIDVNQNQSSIKTKPTEIEDQDIQERRSNLSDDLSEINSINWPFSDEDDNNNNNNDDDDDDDDDNGINTSYC